MKKSILPILLILVFNSLPAQSAPDSTVGNWLMYFGTHRFNEEISLHYETQLRNYELLSNFNQLLPRVGINYHINNQTVVTAGYAFIPTQKEFNQGWNDNLETENRIWEQFILRNSVVNVKPSRETPALANAKIGIIPKATYGDRPCSNLSNIDCLLFFVLWGIVSANNTPAIVACIPDWWVKSHKKIPTIKNGIKLFIRNLLRPIKTINDNNIKIKYLISILPE